MSNNFDLNDDRITVEIHYIPYRLYREIYMGYQQPPTSSASSLYSYPNNITRQNNPYASTHFGLSPTRQQPHNYQYYNNYTHQNQHHQPNQSIQRNTLRNRYSREQETRQAHQTPQEQNTFEPPTEIRNLLSNFLENRLPFELQVSTIPLGMGIGLIQNNTDAELNTRHQPITLSNINIISTVSRFDDLSLSFDLSDTCSICQLSFNDTDITRMLNNCKHVFHLTCIDTWLSEHNTCPSCRHNLTNDLTSNILVQTQNSNTTVINSATPVINSETPVNNLDNLDNVIIEEINNDDTNANTSARDNTTSNTSPNMRTFSNFAYGGINNFRDDINNFINIGTPFINTILPNTFGNVSPILNASEINNNVNTLFENINPIITAFSGLLNGTNMNSHSNATANIRMYSSM